MSEHVKVEEFEVFGYFRVAMLKFAQAADECLSSADSEIAGTRTWLETEQAAHWQSQLRKRTEAVAKARDAVRQKKLYNDSSGRPRSALEEEKALAQCIAAVDQAQQKIEAIRKCIPRLEKEAGLYRSGVARLGETITSDIPRAVAQLDRLAAALEQYVQIESPSSGSPTSAAPSEFEGSVSRGGEAPDAPPPTPTANDQTPATSATPSESPNAKEKPNVADRQ